MKDTDHPHRQTAAARMLAAALQEKQAQGMSLRKLAPMLGYKQATVLSHMANGRIPVPIGKATEIATAVGLSQSEFLIAVMDQREPEAHTLLAAAPMGFELPTTFADELEDIAGKPLDSFTSEQKDIIRKVAVDPRPARRWLSEAEIPTVQMLRRLRPGSEHQGLDPRDRDAIVKALQS